jgi:alpha-D-ribose 1-methylphosphonate 5-triphosphate synthase subunit PhnG
MSDSTQSENDLRQRQEWMAVLAKATADSLEPLWDNVDDKPGWTCVRRPETGMVMVRARAGGTGQRFNMGEMTVTRCVVRLESGAIGHAYVAGRDTRHAELAAVLDALMQQPERRGDLRRIVLDPLMAQQAAQRERTAQRSAATKVDFFTMVRGE